MSVSDVDDRADVWREIYERRVAEMDRNANETLSKVYDLEIFWENNGGGPLPQSYFRSLRTFFHNGLSREVLADLMYEAIGRQGILPWQEWRYFCGCVWNVIKTTKLETELEAAKQ